MFQGWGKIVSDAVGVRPGKREEEAVHSGVLICQTLTTAWKDAGCKGHASRICQIFKCINLIKEAWGHQASSTLTECCVGVVRDLALTLDFS